MIDLHDIGVRLAAYLDTRLASLRVLASGWETTVFEFTLGSASPRFREIPVRSASRPALLPGSAGGR